MHMNFYNRFMNTKPFLLFSALLIASLGFAANEKYFYVFAPKGSGEIGHYAPSGWMGDTGDIRYEEVPDPKHPATKCVKISYSAKQSKGAGWAGIYWQNPNNNWGSRQGGYDLSKYKTLTFKARGAKGGEIISGFKMGGIDGQYADSDSASIGPVTLTADWKTYTIDLAGKNISHIIGGFCVTFAASDDATGMQFFLNDIRYE